MVRYIHAIQYRYLHIPFFLSVFISFLTSSSSSDISCKSDSEYKSWPTTFITSSNKQQKNAHFANRERSVRKVDILTNNYKWLCSSRNLEFTALWKDSSVLGLFGWLLLYFWQKMIDWPLVWMAIGGGGKAMEMVEIVVFGSTREFTIRR